MQKLRRFLGQVVKFFVSFQVELRGHYSADRMQHLSEYGRTTSLGRALFISILLPLPCLLIITSIDAIPINSPDRNYSANNLFWIRDSLIVVIITRAVVEKVQIYVPRLRMTTWHTVIPPIVATLNATAFKCILSKYVGFPLPFQLVLGMPVWFSTLVVCVMCFIGRKVTQSRSLLREVVMTIKVMLSQMLMTFVYPIYLYGFMNISETSRKYYVALLPVIKILARNLISSSFGTKYDLLPQIMIFNVDVFNALYASSSMQSSNSATTILTMILLDTIQAMISLSDINRLMKDILLQQAKIPTNHLLHSACFADVALQIIREDTQIAPYLSHQRYKFAFAALNSVDVIEDSMNPVMATATSLDGSVQLEKAAAPSHALPSRKVGPSPSNLSSDRFLLLGDIFSASERRQFVHKAAQVLFVTEFAILAEYTEVIVPFIYCEFARIHHADGIRLIFWCRQRRCQLCRQFLPTQSSLLPSVKGA
jgi:hypothetical protein